MILPITDQ